MSAKKAPPERYRRSPTVTMETASSPPAVALAAARPELVDGADRISLHTLRALDEVRDPPILKVVWLESRLA